jgi:hypothetical protein
MSLDLPYLSRKFHDNNLTQVDLVPSYQVSNFQKPLLWLNPSPSQNDFAMFSKFQTNHMGSFTIQLGSQPYIFDNFLKCLSATNICFAKYYLNGHHLPLFKMLSKLFQISKPIMWLDAILSKLYNNTNFTIL